MSKIQKLLQTKKLTYDSDAGYFAYYKIPKEINDNKCPQKQLYHNIKSDINFEMKFKMLKLRN